MGLAFLDGLHWAEVTREERVFCQRLLNRIEGEGCASFVAFLNERCGTNLPLEANWEVAYEACFYRDLWHHRGRRGRLLSPKRTFDLCLLSDEAIVVIEAKAAQAFDIQQLESFAEDRQHVSQETGVERVLLLGLVSSRYIVPRSMGRVFDGPLLTWTELAARYGGDELLARADAVYVAGGPWSERNNKDGKISGRELMALHRQGEEFLVGRAGGLGGSSLLEDVRSGRYERQRYQTNRDASEPPNSNWFLLSEMVALVRQQGGSTAAPRRGTPTGAGPRTLSGDELVAAYVRGEELFVGRAGGLGGERLAEDVRTRRWQRQRYQVDREARVRPNRNWFRLSEFVARLQRPSL